MQAWARLHDGATLRPQEPPPNARQTNARRSKPRLRLNLVPRKFGHKTCPPDTRAPAALLRYPAPKMQNHAISSRRRNVYPSGEKALASDKRGPPPKQTRPRHQQSRQAFFQASQKTRSARATPPPDTSPPELAPVAGAATPPTRHLKRKATASSATASRFSESNSAWNRRQCHSITKTQSVCQFGHLRFVCLLSSDSAHSGRLNP